METTTAVAENNPSNGNIRWHVRGEATSILVYSVEKIREDQAMGQIGQPVRRYTVIPLKEPVAPTAELVMPPPPNEAPNNPAPVAYLEKGCALWMDCCEKQRS